MASVRLAWILALLIVNPTTAARVSGSDELEASGPDEVTWKTMPEGVVARTFDDGDDVDEMPVDILKLLEAKGEGARLEHTNFAAEVKTKGSTWWMAATTAHAYQQKFRSNGFAVYLCRETHTWLEYVDLEKAPDYVPAEAYSDEDFDNYEKCQNGNPAPWYDVIASEAMEMTSTRTTLVMTAFHTVGRLGNGGNARTAMNEAATCKVLAISASSRQYEVAADMGLSCKCQVGEELYCGTKAVGVRKFNVNTIASSTCGTGKKDRCWSMTTKNFFGEIVKDEGKHDCDWYEKHTATCGRLDTSSFRANEQCCACGGGIQTLQATKENVAYCARPACMPA